MTSLQKESELENLPWQFRFEKLYRKLHGLPDNDPLLTGHCQTFIKAFEQILHEEISNREKEIAEEVEKYALYCQKESAEQLERENVMLAYDMDSRQVAAKKILQILKH